MNVKKIRFVAPANHDTIRGVIKPGIKENLMTSSPRYSKYDGIARVYNQHWGDRFLPTSLAALENLALCHLPGNAAILDLCCGTGQLALALTKRGYEVTGLDGSPEMLSFARKNATGAKFILDDARTFTLPTRYHLVVSMFDSLNHILEPRELSSVFTNVCASLRKKGLFLFDLITEKGYQANWNGFWGIVEDDHVCISQWRRTDVILPERWYTEEEIRSALELASFQKITVYQYDGESGFKNLTEEAERAFFLCYKP